MLNMREGKLIKRSHFTVVAMTDQVIAIIDESEQFAMMSVTNDAENVVMWLHEKGVLENRRLVYRDTEGRWGQLLHDGHGTFLGFKNIKARSIEEATR